MRARSPRWLAAVRRPHSVAVQVDVLYNRVVLLAGLAVADGSVTLDRGAAQLSRCDVVFVEPTRIRGAAGPLSPFGYEVAIKRGIRYSDGTTELMPLGVFPIQTSDSDGVTLGTRISAVDRSQLVIDARLEDDYQIAAGTNYADAIRDLIRAGVDGLTYSFASTIYTTPLLTFPAQSDRWELARQMATAIGFEVFFDGEGRCVLRPELAFTAGSTPVWDLTDGDDGVMLSVQLSQDRGPAFNRVVVTGQNSSLGFIPRAVWTDSSPVSPTQYNALRFGRKPRFYSSPFVSTDAQAQSAADALGARLQGVAASVNFAAVPDPAVEAGDVILVERGALGLRELHVIDTLQIGLSAAGQMAGTSRVIGRN